MSNEQAMLIGNRKSIAEKNNFLNLTLSILSSLEQRLCVTKSNTTSIRIIYVWRLACFALGFEHKIRTLQIPLLNISILNILHKYTVIEGEESLIYFFNKTSEPLHQIQAYKLHRKRPNLFTMVLEYL